MRLDYNCVRDVMLEVETKLGVNQEMDLSAFVDLDYSEDQILYAVSKLFEARYLDCIDTSTFCGKDYMIRSITWNGHAFLDNIRDEKTFNEAKETIRQKVGSASLSILASVTNAIILKSLGLG